VNINDILHPEAILASLGPLAIVVACLIVIAETGLLLGFFLPGDSLLFTVGLMIGGGVVQTPIWVACLAISVSAVIGDQIGYFIGRKGGPKVFNKPESKLFSHKNVERAEAFFHKYGAKAVIFAHYVPIMRTFIPVAAGVGNMKYSYYLRNNLIGALSWGISVPLIGCFLGNVAFIREHVIIVTLALVALSFIPVTMEIIKARKR
jgi:membrane-associated protein